jgi:hypothetical protein
MKQMSFVQHIAQMCWRFDTFQSCIYQDDSSVIDQVIFDIC